MRFSTHRLAALLLVIPVVIGIAAAEVPQLARLKAAAEAGDAHSQFEFALQFGSGTPERARWLRAAAAQDLGEAQDEIAWTSTFSIFATYFPEEKARASYLKIHGDAMRESLLLASVAADKGFGRSRVLLALAYSNGYLVPSDTIEGYKWAKIANTSDLFAADLRRKLQDRLLKDMPISSVEEGERRAAVFRPGGTANAIRTQLAIPYLKLSGVATIHEQRVAIVNGSKLVAGQDSDLHVGKELITIHVISIGSSTVILSFPPSLQRYELKPGTVAAAL